MLQIIRLLVALPLGVVGIYFGIKGFTKSIERYKINVDKIDCARIAARNFTFSLIFMFLAVETYTPSLVCIPFLFVFIGLAWLDYAIYKKTTRFLKR